MKAVLCKRHGPPDVLTLDEVPAPTLADDQVRIRVLACGINFPDVLMVAGKYQAQPPVPFTIATILTIAPAVILVSQATDWGRLTSIRASNMIRLS